MGSVTAATVSNFSLDRSAGGVFFNMTVGFEVVANRRARSNLTLGSLYHPRTEGE
jgi:hypothetical protein